MVLQSFVKQKGTMLMLFQESTIQSNTNEVKLDARWTNVSGCSPAMLKGLHSNPGYVMDVTSPYDVTFKE